METKNPKKMIKYVIKRSGKKEEICEDKIFYRIKKIIDDPLLGKLDHVSSLIISREVVDNVIDGVTTTELDNIAAKIAMEKRLSHHINYEQLAVRIAVSNMHKNTTNDFSTVMESLYNNRNKKGNVVHLVNDRLINVVRKNKDLLNSKIDYTRDYTLTDYFGLKTFEKSYLIRKFDGKDKVIAERIQHLYMRVSIGIHYEDIPNVLKTYDILSQGYGIHASPTLFNAGTECSQLSSCFILPVEDSMVGIGKNLTDSMLISKRAGGIGKSYSKIRCAGSDINGTNGFSSGIVPFIKLENAAANASNQGGRRKGSYAIYLDMWHGDIFQFLDLPKKSGDENLRARDLFYGLWISDIFMEAVKNKGKWYLMNPDECTGIVEAVGEDMKKLYYSYVEKGMYIKEIEAQDLWIEVLKTQIETGMPYIGYKDAVNLKSNQKNLGTILSSNLCNEINIYHDPEEYGTCNIATISLPKFVETLADNSKIFNFQKLKEIAKHFTLNLNRVIDNNFYPVPETKNSNLKHRPIALGSQGISGVFFLFGYSFESDEARKLNKEIFETIQFGALEASCELAKKEGAYSTFKGSPSSKGIFQHNMWGVANDQLSGMWDWDSLKEKVIKHGLRNSLMTASPPTATTSQLLGNFESMEPIHSNVFGRTTLSGDFVIVNRYLINDLMKLNLWNNKMYKKIIANRGSVQAITEIPEHIRNIYKTVWEIKQKRLADYSADRGIFTDQTQSFNVYFQDATVAKLNSLHFHTWKIGLKTGLYYLRSQTKAKQAAVTVEKEPEVIESEEEEPEESEVQVCYINNPECAACSG